MEYAKIENQHKELLVFSDSLDRWLAGKECKLYWNKMKIGKWDTDYWLADTSKTAKLLKWSPKVDLAQGLLLTWRWFKNNLHFYS